MLPGQQNVAKKGVHALFFLHGFLAAFVRFGGSGRVFHVFQQLFRRNTIQLGQRDQVGGVGVRGAGIT
jgi:hypothetical protein